MTRMEIDKIQVPEGRRPVKPLDGLCQSISEIGLLNPITITEKRILIAGRNRLEACRKLGWREIPAITLSLSEVDSQIAEIDENLIRNELTVLERSEHLARRKVLYESKYPEAKAGGDRKSAEAKSKRNHFVLIPASGPAASTDEKEVSHTTHTEALSSGDAADKQMEQAKLAPGPMAPSFAADTAAKTNVTPRTIQQEVKIAEDIKPEVRDQIRDTPIAASKTELLKMARMPEPEQRAVAQKIATGEARNVKEARHAIRREEQRIESAPETTDAYRLITSDVSDLSKHLADGSIDLIITDPPYPREFLPVYSALARAASRLLKPGGSLVVMIGQSYLPEVVGLLASVDQLKYQWVLAYLTPGESPQMWQRKVNTFWKPVLWFVNGQYSGNWIGDVAKSSTNDKRFHDWGQSESGFADLLERFSKPGDLILDPFLGGGTTGVVSVAMRRRFIGSDIDPKCIELAASRMAGQKANAA